MAFTPDGGYAFLTETSRIEVVNLVTNHVAGVHRRRLWFHDAS
jgi:hypothetical protein